ncbi:hypothetical protein DFJ73DRAFT_950776 [Zopfochytrium polystomum]|nr:hypothetical protein DFJ73DRAFT_950776 [Zopfochytrium polystomum]
MDDHAHISTTTSSSSTYSSSSSFSLSLPVASRPSFAPPAPIMPPPPTLALPPPPPLPRPPPPRPPPTRPPALVLKNDDDDDNDNGLRLDLLVPRVHHARRAVNPAAAANSNTSSSSNSSTACAAEYHLECFADAAGPPYFRTMEAMIAAHAAIILFGAYVSVLLVRLARRKRWPHASSPHGRRGRLGLRSLKASLRAVSPMGGAVALAMVLAVNDLLTVVALRLKMVLLFEIFQAVGIFACGLFISLLMYAFIGPLVPHTPDLRPFMPLLYLIPLPPLLDAGALLWLGVLERQLATLAAAAAAAASSPASSSAAASDSLQRTRDTHAIASWLDSGRPPSSARSSSRSSSRRAARSRASCAARSAPRCWRSARARAAAAETAAESATPAAVPFATAAAGGPMEQLQHQLPVVYSPPPPPAADDAARRDSDGPLLEAGGVVHGARDDDGGGRSRGRARGAGGAGAALEPARGAAQRGGTLASQRPPPLPALATTTTTTAAAYPPAPARPPSTPSSGFGVGIGGGGGGTHAGSPVRPASTPSSGRSVSGSGGGGARASVAGSMSGVAVVGGGRGGGSVSVGGALGGLSGGSAAVRLEDVERELRLGSVRAVRSILGWMFGVLGLAIVCNVGTQVAGEFYAESEMAAFGVWLAGNVTQSFCIGLGVAVFYVGQYKRYYLETAARALLAPS